MALEANVGRRKHGVLGGTGCCRRDRGYWEGQGVVGGTEGTSGTGVIMKDGR